MLFFFKFSFFLGGIIPLFLGIFIYLENRKGIVNKTYSGLSLCCAIWSFGFLFMITTFSRETSSFWRWFMESGSIIIPAFWLHFVYAFLGIDKVKKKKIIFIYSVSLFLWLLNLTDLFALGLFTKEMTRKYIFD